jgi:hypothetical protein
MTAKSQGGAPSQKRTRTATVTYPYHSLESCLKLAEAVKQIGNGRQDVDKSLLASHLKADEQSGEFAQKIASSKTYGMIEGKGVFQLSEAARAYFLPTTDPEASRKSALFKFLSTPGAFKALIDRYDGSRLESLEIMGNILSQSYGVPNSWSARVAAFFSRSASFVGALGPDSCLRYKAQTLSVGNGEPNAGNPPSKPKERDLLPPNNDTEDGTTDQSGVIVWKYPVQGMTLRVETPENMTKEIWEKLNKYIQVLKP